MMPAYLTPEQHVALKVLSKTNGRPMQEFLREGIDLVLAKYKKEEITMRKFIALLIVLLISSPMIARAEYTVYTAGWLRDLCSTKEKSGSFVTCMIFLRGVRDGMGIGRIETLNLSGVEKKEITNGNKYSSTCLPKDVKLDQLGEMFFKYMNERPEELHENAAEHFFYMLIKYFPCKK